MVRKDAIMDHAPGDVPDTVSSIHGGTEFLHDQYDYDGHGNVLAITDARSGAAGRRTRSMGYDDLDRLTSVASPMYGSTGANYSYNVLDDLTSLSIGGAKARSASYVYDASRRLTRVTRTAGGRVAALLLGYDAQGNLASRGDLLTSQQYRFDFGNRLREVEGVERYRYDGHGRRVLAMNFGSGTVLSQYGLDGRLLYQHSERTGLSTEHVYLGGSLLATREWPLAGGADTVKYQHTDALGSPVVVTRQDRSIVEETEYEPYGSVLNRPMHDGAGYTGHVEDAATGLVYMQQRYYDPMLGVFLSVDPVTAYDNPVSQFHRYRYANNNPYRFTDPDGRQSRVGGSERFHENAPPPPPPPASTPVPTSSPTPVAQSPQPSQSRTPEKQAVEQGRSRVERAEIIGQQELAKRPFAHNDVEDGMRHAEWTRRMSEEIDPFTSWMVGTAHEARGLLEGQDLGEARMDLNNNAEGRAAASEGRAVDPRRLQSSPESANGRY